MRTRTADLLRRTGPPLVAAALLCPAPAVAAPEQPVPYCTPHDEGLAELSGMAVLDGRVWAMGDSGTDDRIAELADPAADGSCSVTRWVANPVAPFDVEDVAAFGSDLWLGDTGDNRRIRATVALTRLDPATGGGELHRMTFPDGPHDVEALLIGPDGVPVLVTKELTDPAGVYVPDLPVSALPAPGPTPLRRVGQARLDTVLPSGSTMPGQMVTGGAVSVDGRVAALRTYTDLYLYPVPEGGVAAALTSQQPQVIRLPVQPQGEAMAFTPGGDLLLGSESGGTGRPLPPVLILRGAAQRSAGSAPAGLFTVPGTAVPAPALPGTALPGTGPEPAHPDLRWAVAGVLGAGGLALLIARAVARRRRARDG